MNSTDLITKEVSRLSVGVDFKYKVEENGAPVPLAQFSSLKQFLFEGPQRQVRTLAASALNGSGTDGWLLSVGTPASFFDVGGIWKYRPHLVLDSGHDFYGQWREFRVTT